MAGLPVVVLEPKPGGSPGPATLSPAVLPVRQSPNPLVLKLPQWETAKSAQFLATNDEWEALRPIIYELYITRNCPLRVVADTMKITYGLKASDRMYKTRFAKWKWKKTDTARAVQSTRASRQFTKQIVKNPRGNVLSSTAPYARVMHESQLAATVEAAMQAYRNYTISWAEADPRWTTPNKYHDIDITCKPFSLQEDIRMATSYLLAHDYTEGGRFLRLAFLAIEAVVLDDHLHSAWDLFVWCPLRIYRLPRPMADKIIRAYSSYLYQQTLIKRRNHPMAVVARSLHEAAAAHGIRGVVPVISKISHLLHDLYLQLRGLGSAAIVKLAVYADAIQHREMQIYVMDSFMQTSAQASAELGENAIEALFNMCIALSHRVKLGIIDEVLLSSGEHVAVLISKRYQQSQDLSVNSWYDKFNEHWTYRNTHWLLARYWAQQGDMEKVISYCRVATDLGPDPDMEAWKITATLTENLLREHGLMEEAGQLASRRQSCDMTPEARKTLEKEEVMDLTDVQDDDIPVKQDDGDDSEGIDDIE
ncbi:hypothetical protein BX600DRAFT_456376 [Xylariales sp. PMI_506]|nr:hypothetical protein BX600DRAFT_456376 [Xylariales sp. PMI_506]